MAYGVILNQKPQKKMLPEIIITPLDDSISFVYIVSSTGERWEVLPNSQGIYISQLKTFGVYQVEISTDPMSPTTTFEVNVDICKQYNYVFPQPSGSLDDNSWAAIKYASDNNLGESLWAVGDSKEITIDGQIDDELTLNNYSTYVFILGFNHNEVLEGQGITFGGFKSELSGSVDIALIDSRYSHIQSSGSFFQFYHINSNVGGWENSLMRKTIVPQFKSCLESDLISVLKTVNKYTDNVGGGSGSVQSNISATQDQIFLLAEFEVFGTHNYANTYEQNYQKQYQYYIDGNSKVKLKYNSASAYSIWWLRSNRVSSSSSFCGIDAHGNENTYAVRYSYGFAPAFVV